MPRYFFDTDDGERCIQDDEGFEFQDACEAHDAAVRALPEIARDGVPAGARDVLTGAGRDFVTSVRDAGHRLVCKVTLSVRTEWLIPAA